MKILTLISDTFIVFYQEFAINVAFWLLKTAGLTVTSWEKDDTNATT
jgi:hypothetical protein